MRRFIEKSWQQGHPVLWLLSPLMLLYALITAVRRFCYRCGIFRQVKLPVPVVIVGNITVGGNGKTPMVVWLAQHLTQQGYHVGIISRGYGGSATEAILVDNTTSVALTGDEPKLIVAKTSCLMAIGRDRIAAAHLILAKAKSSNNPLDVIISDDGLQHYRLARDFEIAVVDGVRRLGNRKLLPMGPLRESPSRLKSVDLIICNGHASHYNEQSMTLVPDNIIRLHDNKIISVEDFCTKQVVAMAGIGYPQRFFDTLTTLNIPLIAQIPFADHQAFEFEQLARLVTEQQCLIMTEKDAVKCQDFVQKNWYYLPVTAEITLVAKELIFKKIKELTHGV
ncbi:MAG: tetraacyldisaccharide 4'-kinase [Gammaproteobacteria bacterium]|nr:tetraacyldisaccharide 4'-kinase [Gammaproteobacteria bacterium]